MSLLDEWLQLPASMRRLRLGHADTQDAIAALGTDAGVAWLEMHIESPVVPEWERILFRLEPQWHHLERWMRLSSLHCLAAINALLLYCRAPEMPSGANPRVVNDALDLAIAAYGNRRLNDAAREIRYVWPMGLRIRHTVNVPIPLACAGGILFQSNSNLMCAWHESMATAMEPTDGPEDVWESLLRFGEARGLIAIVDWRESPRDALASLQDLQAARTMALAWERLVASTKELEDALSAIGSASVLYGQTLVSLDHGADDYALTFLPSDSVSRVESLINSLVVDTISVRAFGQS